MEKKEAPKWVQDVQERISEKRDAIRKEKFDNLAKASEVKLNDLMNLYFMNLTNDSEEQVVTFDILNKEWKDYVYKVNSTQKIISLNHDAFEKNINDILNSEEYKEKLKEKELIKSEIVNVE